MSAIKRRIIFNATILNDRLTGLGVYCKNILDRIGMDFDSIIYTDKYNDYNKHCKKNIVLDTNSNNKLKSIILRNYSIKRFIIRNKKENILHYSPTQHGVNTKGIKQIITIHDLMPLYFPKGRIHQYIYYKFLLKRIINNSNKIITVSNNTKNDIIKEYKIKEEKIKVIYNGFDEINEKIDKDFSKRYVKEKYNLEDYILMVGIHYSYKNLHRVIEAYDECKNILNKSIAIVGGYDCKYGKELINLVNKKGLNKNIKFLGFVDNYDKNKLYQGADLFIYPSLYEGFGLPVLEAMANETLVACSNTSSLPEVVGEAAYKFDPCNIKEIEKALINMTNLKDEEYLDYMSKAKKQLMKFSWDKCSREIKDVIDEVNNDEVS